MALTKKQISDLNRMNAAAQRAGLGTFIDKIGDTSFVVSKDLESSDISGSIVTIPLIVKHATILSYSVTDTDGIVRTVTKATVDGTNALLTVTSVVETDIVHIIYGIWM